MKSQHLTQPASAQHSRVRAAVLQPVVIVFSKNYLPMSQVTIRRAIVLLLTGQAEALGCGSGRQWEVRSPHLVLVVPEQIRLLHAHPERFWKTPAVTRRAVLRRDHHTCQYCGSSRQLTLDHVLPRSRGGSHTWDNVVTACAPCNGRKGDRLPQEAGMTLAHKPKAPMHPALQFAEQFWQTQTLA